MTIQEATERADRARELLLDELRRSKRAALADEMVSSLAGAHPEVSDGDLKGAVWSLVSLGSVELTWDGKIRLLQLAAG